MRYLDPKNDLVFKRIFGEHPNITISFLNALLPLEPENQITSIEYLPTEIIPDQPGIYKNSIVDVRCKDALGRHFIVEMQMIWTETFKTRVLYNACKIFVRQLEIGDDFKILVPVYALNIVNEWIDKKGEDWYHHYKMLHVTDRDKDITALELIFVDLPKFQLKNLTDKKLTVLWLRFLKEIENDADMISDEIVKELSAVPEIAEALELAKSSGYTKAELEAYDRYWDMVRTQKAMLSDAEAKGKLEGKLEIAKTLKSQEIMSIEQISELTGLTIQEVNDL